MVNTYNTQPLSAIELDKVSFYQLMTDIIALHKAISIMCSRYKKCKRSKINEVAHETTV
ncbi:hypothetical protein [Streptococcus sciuri]|uniref:Uncharacterized protein n=1 Tax=Streptococcus sciuri TaxID=2973939 RepID=A0ABT2F7E1_9STRE|nr:hypothetical protein [Streptococcus sciuri]MCS4488113.1 hypothetical protein [Streptococcus sciuri]